MNNKLKFLFSISVLILFFVGCSKPKEGRIFGTIDYLGDVDFYVETIPLHYKYSEKNQFPIKVILFDILGLPSSHYIQLDMDYCPLS